MFRDAGYSVRGSDSNVYPPMSDMLAAAGITVHGGFSHDQVGNPDLVVIGNAMSRGNPEVEYVLNSALPYTSMAAALHDHFLRGREVIAVAGTHGKSTTSALLAHILRSAGADPSCFVGGVMKNYASNYFLGSGNYFVIEGDEYDSAFFEKIPKFVLYRPRHCILTSLEFDHADIYRDLDEIELWFRRLVAMVPSQGTIVYSPSYPALKRVMEKSYTPSLTFGESADCSWSFKGYDGDEAVIVLTLSGTEALFRTSLFGSFNYDNIAAAVALCLSLRIPLEEIQRGVATFRGVKRRQELIYSRAGLRVYEDFAHHPTAIALVLETMRHRYPDAVLWAVYEPRSATSRRRVFQRELPLALARADRALVKTPYNPEAIAPSERIDARQVCDDANAAGGNVRLCSSVDEILRHIAGEVDVSTSQVIVIMSNGGFDGIYGKLAAALDEKAAAAVL